MVNEILEALLPELIMFLISSNISNNLIFQQLVCKRNKDNTNLLEIKQKDRQMTDFQIFQMTCEKGKNLKLSSMDKLLYFKNTMASI